MQSYICDRKLPPSNINNMVTWTRLAQWHHWLTCQNGMRKSYKAPSLKEKLLRINLIQRKAFWVYVCFSVFRVNTQDWSIPIIQSQVVNHKQRNLSITKWTCQVVLMYTYTYMCICLGYFSITVNIPDQGCYQRVHWVNRFRGWVWPFCWEHGSRQAGVLQEQEPNACLHLIQKYEAETLTRNGVDFWDYTGKKKGLHYNLKI